MLTCLYRRGEEEFMGKTNQCTGVQCTCGNRRKLVKLPVSMVKQSPCRDVLVALSIGLGIQYIGEL